MLNLFQFFTSYPSCEENKHPVVPAVNSMLYVQVCQRLWYPSATGSYGLHEDEMHHHNSWTTAIQHIDSKAFVRNGMQTARETVTPSSDC